MSALRLHLVLFALAVLPATLGLWNEVQEVDPAQYADVAARMLRSGDFLVPRDSFGPHLNKPPMMMWTQALCMALFGQGSFAARLPALVFLLVAAWAVFRIGKLMHDARLGALAACLFAASAAFQLMAADPKVDTPLTAFTALAIWAVLEARTRPYFMWAAWVFAGFAVLSKGPLGVVLPVLALAPVVLRADWSAEPRSLVQRLLALHPFRGLVIVGGLSAAFYLSVGLANGGGAAFDLIWTQGFGRVLGQTDWIGTTTPAFYLHTALWAFLPGSPLAVFGLGRRAWARWKKEPPRPALEALPLYWLLLPMAVMSVPSYKLPQHIYCLAPAAALLAAQELMWLSQRAHPRFRLGWALIGLGGVGAAAATLVVIFPAGLPELLGWSGALLLGLVLALVVARRFDAVEASAVYALAATTGFFVFFHAAFQPALLRYQPWDEAGAKIRALEPDGRTFIYVGEIWSFGCSFYAQRECEWLLPPDLAARVKANEAQHALVAEADLEKVRATGLSWDVLERWPLYPTSTARPDFLRASTRAQTLRWVTLLRLRAP